MESYCTACERHFATIAAYRKHRTGRFMPNTRRCRSAHEMERVRLFEQDGMWHLTRPIEFFQETVLVR